MNGYKALITHLQELPRLIVPVKIYPYREGEYQGSGYYATANDEASVDALTHYLPHLSSWKNLVFEARERSDIKNLAEEITSPCQYNMDKISAIHRWVFRNIGYKTTREIISPWKLIETRQGDCKSLTCLISALLGVLNISSWFKLVQLKGYEARHIYSYVKASWYPVDGTGLYCFEEIKRVTGYILFEIDRTYDMPPAALPSPGEAEVVPPPLLATLEGEGAMAIVAMFLLLGAIKE